MDNVHLIGADDVRSAGHTMKQAAENMQSAANSIAEANDRMLLNLQGILDQFISEVRGVMQEADLSGAFTSTTPLAEGHMRHTVRVGNIVDTIEGTPEQIKAWIGERERRTTVGIDLDLSKIA